jgi:hypothetical protein
MEALFPFSRFRIVVAAGLALQCATPAFAESIDSTRPAPGMLGLVGGVGWMPNGALSAPAGGGNKGSLAGTRELPYLGGVNVAFDYSGQAGGVGAKARLSKVLDGAKVTWTSSLDGRLDGLGIGGHMNEGWLDLTGAPLPLGFGLRESTAIDGSRNEVLRSTQTLSRSFGTLRNSTDIAVGGAGTETATGTLNFTRLIGTFGVSAQLDYAATTSLHPSAARLGVERNVERGWSLYLDADRKLDGSGLGRVDFGAARRIGSVTAGPVAGAAADGNAYIGARLTIPLSPGARIARWVGLGRS